MKRPWPRPRSLPSRRRRAARRRRSHGTPAPGQRKVAFVTALADLARIFTARDTTAWLTAIADASVGAAIDHLLLAGHEAGKLTLKNPENPAEGSGLIVLGMGKHGARELNYSSDIDLVVFYDPDAGILKDPDDAMETMAG